MINSLRNIRNVPIYRFLTDTALVAAAIYGAIYLRSSGHEVKEVEKFVPSAQVTTEKGLYINGFRIPIELLKKDKEIVLPYDAVANPERGINLLVDDPNIEVSILRRERINWTLEAKLEPAKKEKEGKDGLSLQGDLPSEYLLRIRANNQDYLVRLAR